MDRTVDSIVGCIREGRYVPGQRLVEADLVEDLGVSRSSIREALRRLEALGLIEMVLHRGARVRRLTADEVRELEEVRAIVESGAARLAACRSAGSRHTRAMTAALTAMGKAADRSDVLEFVDAVGRFHEALLGLSGNQRLAVLIDNLRLQTVRPTLVPYLSNPSDLMQRSHERHSKIMEYVLAGDADRAEKAVRSFAEETAALTLRAVSQL